MRIGIDIGGTNTDAVLVDERNQIIAQVKVPTQEFIEKGVVHALSRLPKKTVTRISVGSTHAINAILQQKGLFRVGVIRIAGHRPDAIYSCMRWPKPLKEAILVDTVTIDGGFECDGRSITSFEKQQVLDAAEFLLDKGAESIAIVCPFSSLYPEHEIEAAILLEKMEISLSHQIGGIGFIERENTTILNAALKKVMSTGFANIKKAINDLDYHCPIFISQNNGSVISLEQALKNPVLTLSSGATNSFAGGGKLAQLQDAIVVDIGGTSTDVGILKNGYPRKCLQNSNIGGVTVNFSAPDLLSIALGGGSVINGEEIGPQSCAKDLFYQGCSFGGKLLTFTDIAIAMGQISISCAKKMEISGKRCMEIMKKSSEMINRVICRFDPSERSLPVVLVGGGASLIPKEILDERYLIPENAHIANAYGAALGEASATIDEIVCLDRREEIIEKLKAKVLCEAGSISRIVDMQIIPYHYMPGNKARVIMMAVGQ